MSRPDFFQAREDAYKDDQTKGNGLELFNVNH